MPDGKYLVKISNFFRYYATKIMLLKVDLLPNAGFGLILKISTNVYPSFKVV